ncbi:sterol desaturase family protein [Lusitaniella coriacea LEGE 07157]|uniref:Sterol desaturase family protein n=1 Tax=Lusitaniella coriacea LEGE 07157 TaxID=945747 RepID=A0A8J7JE93_9CYAN|nr:sterol desaturase family protein [Lusitaniella coriacea]MBE9118720.1 sterol desaturase family protein [Lusitaniella coriacea LEGE 07157]
MNFWLYWLFFSIVILIRYFLVAGGTYLFFYSSLNRFTIKRNTFLELSNWRFIKKDIKLSIAATVILAFCSAVVMFGYDLGITKLYASLDRYGIWYLGLSFVGILVLQDTCFYFIHRVFHHPVLFRWLHLGHHRSTEPTPWTSFALDPPEALMQGLFLMVVVFVIPLHFMVLVALLLTMTIWAVLNHLGFELFDSSFARHWFGKWFVGSTYHAIHHRKYKMNYGLYFTFWDRFLDTYDFNYETKFDSFLK